MDEQTKEKLKKIPLLTVNAGPRDGEEWIKRLKEEYAALIKYVQMNKEADMDWFFLESNKTGTRLGITEKLNMKVDRQVLVYL